MTGELRGRPVLVTGATGFLGGHLVRALVQAGADVHAIRRPEGARVPALPLPEVTWHAADLLDAARLDAVLRDSDPDVTFHLAAYGANRTERDPDTLYRVNVTGTWNLWQALSHTRSRLVMTGTSAEYGVVRGRAAEGMVCRPVSAYAACKHAAVMLVTSLARHQRRPAVVLRPYSPFGPGDDPTHVLPYVLAGLINGDRVRLTGAEQVRSFMYVDDLVPALIRAAAKTGLAPGAIYNVGSEEAVTIRELVARIAAATGPAGPADAAAAGPDGPAREAVEFGALPYDEHELFEVVPDVSAARRDLDFAPAVSLDEGIRRTADWMRRVRQGSIA